MKFVRATENLDRAAAEFFPPGNNFDRGRMKFGVGLWKTNFQYESWPEAPSGSAHQSA